MLVSHASPSPVCVMQYSGTSSRLGAERSKGSAPKATTPEPGGPSSPTSSWRASDRRRVDGDVESLVQDDVIDRRAEAHAHDVGGLDEPAVARADAAQRSRATASRSGDGRTSRRSSSR